MKWGMLGADPRTNPFNMELSRRRFAPGNAFRYALTPNCNPITGAPQLSPAQQRDGLLHVPVIASVAGDNILIPTVSNKILIYEIFLWNSTALPINWELFQGASANGILLLPLSNWPATTGFILGFNGNWEQPHFIIDSGQSFVLNASTAGPTQGFIKYKIANGIQ